MQLDLPFAAPDAAFRLQAEENAPPAEEYRTEFVRVRKARRYILRIRPDGTLRVTIPRGGSRAEATAFAAKHVDWIVKERARVRRERAPVRWTHGTLVLLEGAAFPLEIERTPGSFVARYAGRAVAVDDPYDVRGEVEADLRAIAGERLLPRLFDLARMHGLDVSRVTIRSQRSRWGSCSRRGAIALNFRLVQMPPRISDYVLIHELMHLRQQNHGPRFWALVERACPEYRDCERWLRRAGRSLF